MTRSVRRRIGPPTASLPRLRTSAATAALWLCLAATAQAGLDICNDTGHVQSVAIGFKGDVDWTSQGWWNIDPGDCATVVGGDLTRRYYYYFADSAAGAFQGQDYMFCASDEVFDIVGDIGCEDRGFETLSMREIDTGETARDFTLTLVDDGGEMSGGDKIAPKLEGDLTAGLTAGPFASTGPGGPVAGAPVTEGVQDTTVVPPEEMPITVSVEDLVTDIPAGRHGKSFETPALFQGCELEGGRSYCSFHAGDQKMRVFYRGPTPETLMFALEELAVNMPVTLAGDMVETTGNVAAIVVRSVVPAPGEDANSRLRARLQGDWIDQGDRRWEMTVHGSEIFFRRDGEFATQRFFRLAEACEGTPDGGPVMVQINTDTGRRTCYRIDRSEGGVLELTDLRRGRTSVYRRAR